MATKSKSKERGSNYGGENHGTRVQYEDGTWGFIQGVAHVDASDPEAVAPVKKVSPDNNTYGSVVTDPQLSLIHSVLVEILDEIRLSNLHLNEGSDSDYNLGDL